MRRSPKKGSSVEFADFRNYTRGDDLRRVDWNAYARLNKLFLKLFVEEQDTTLHVLVDSSRSMTFGDRSKMLFAQKVAAALSYMALESYDRAAVGFFGERLLAYYGPVSGKASWMGVWDFIGRHMNIEGAPATEFDRSLKEFGLRRPPAGVAVVISDLFTPDYQAGIKTLQVTGQEVVLIHVMSPEEISPQISGEVRLYDSETGERKEVSITPGLLRAYQRKVEEYCDSVRRFCVSRNIAYLRVSSDEPVESFILHGMRAAGLIR